MGSTSSTVTGTKRILSKTIPKNIITPSTKPDVSRILREDGNDGELVKNMNELMDKNRTPFKAGPASTSLTPASKSPLKGVEDYSHSEATNLSDDVVGGQSRALFDALDPTAPTIQKSYAKDNVALNILQSRKMMILNDEKMDLSNLKQDHPYKLSTTRLIELLRTSRQDPELYRDSSSVNEKNNITNLINHVEVTDTLREFYNAPELYAFNQKRANNI